MPIDQDSCETRFRMPRLLGITPRLPVADLQRTANFYTRHFGFRVDGCWPDGQPTFLMMSCEQTRLQFYRSDSSEPCGHATLSLHVEDVQALHRSLADHLPIEWGPEVYWYGCREFAVRDPDGYLLIVSEETQDPPTCQDA